MDKKMNDTTRNLQWPRLVFIHAKDASEYCTPFPFSFFLTTLTKCQRQASFHEKQNNMYEREKADRKSVV